ncbi:hypothetical protein J32TS6_29860 [Virgibacillus pantothenticus]|uniref:DUF3278 domain-containing protein n=1 Tax=Virgibacillus pantothenticus TaxID=1473 RepID=UPI001B0385E1|nr:DUF3278 domain-containing protein [Virgibacillus pantothenticus]GIP64431.1 hypothetical protein J32TS6_29860 [Virgibacillus pantothenticus]
MKHSFLHVFLPKDEYKRMRVVRFLAEAAVILAIMLILTVLISSWFAWSLDGMLLAFAAFSFILIYTYLRYILSGIEFTDVINKENYSKTKRNLRKRAIRFGAIFFIVLLLIRGIPNSWIDFLDILGPSVLASIFMLIFDRLSLKKSYEKNKELLE